MSRPPRWYSSTDGLEPLPLALLAGGGDAGHHRQVGVDDAGAVAVGAGALGVGAEQRRLHAVGLRERLADRVEQSGVRRRVAPSRAADRALVDRHHTRAGGDRPVHERALAGAGDAGDDDEHPERDVDVDVRRLCAVAPRISSVPVGVRTVSLRAARSSRWRPVMVPLARSPSTVPSKQTVPPAVPAPGPRSTTWSAIAIVSGLCSTTSTVLPLSRSRSSRSFIRWMSWGCRPDGGLVEDVGDVGERGAEVADHLGALRLAARQRARRPVEREVAQPDLHERVEGLLQRREQRRHRRLVEAADPVGQVADLHRAGVGDVDPLDLRRPGRLAEPGAVALGAGR